MARRIRQGLPRSNGGGPWPDTDQPQPDESSELNAVIPPGGGAVESATLHPPQLSSARHAAPASRDGGRPPSRPGVRSGLPREPGGASWPPVFPRAAREEASGQSAAVPVAPAAAGAELRRGLPRVAGGEPFPPDGIAPVRRSSPPEEDPPVDAAVALQPLALPAFEPEPAPVPEETVVAGAVEEERPPAAHSSPRTPEQSRPGASRRLYRGRTIGRWSALALLAGLAALVVAAIVVLAARGVTTLPGVPQFMQRYPGEYDLPVVAEPGFPAWVRWTHFLNFFLMVLIIRTGLQVRHQQKPPALWASRRDGKKISIFLWLHTSLDVIWLLNGLLFVVLLFATGHWVRIVPTSLEVFPNAVSALLQYLTLEWPTENGWVNYNSLQQLMYFSVVFIAAPIAALTGLRMSEWWPENAVRVNRIYPAKLARALHFPTMLFFVVFIVVHVFLVFATGALRNLNHMFGGRDVVNWSGFWWFAGGLFATGVMLVLAARPMVIAPIAGLFGKVSSR